jgi:hypothetical protein
VCRETSLIAQEGLLKLNTSEFGLKLKGNQIGNNILHEVNIVKFLRRLLLIIVILVTHYLFMFLPISELFLLYIIFFKPKWFQNF